MAENISVNPNYVKELDPTGNMIVEKTYDKVVEMNIDWFSAVVGIEGVGKSTLALNLYLKWCLESGFPTSTIEDTLIYDEDELLRFLSNLNPSNKNLPIFMDEGANILFNRDSMSKQRSYVLKFFNVMRFLNSYVLICTPNIRFLDKNVRAHRLKSMFYIPERGVYWYYEKGQIERMIQLETTKKWFWIEPKYVGTYRVNPVLEKITLEIKKNYVIKLTEKIREYMLKRDLRTNSNPMSSSL